MSKMQRSKGARIEGARFSRAAQGTGIHAEKKCRLSGAAGGRFKADVDVYALGRDVAPLVTEVKARGNGEGFCNARPLAWRQRCHLPAPEPC